jgi:hypothetical protein
VDEPLAQIDVAAFADSQQEPSKPYSVDTRDSMLEKRKSLACSRALLLSWKGIMARMWQNFWKWGLDVELVRGWLGKCDAR